MRIAMIGSGYVGLVSGACFAEFGHRRRLRRQGRGQDRPAAQGRDADLRARPRQAGRRQRARPAGSPSPPTSPTRWATPTRCSSPSARRRRRGDGHADLTYVYAAAAEIADAIRGYTVVVTKSTVPVGTGREVARIIRETAARRPSSTSCSNPEFLREGAAIEDFMQPDRVVIGVESRARARRDGGDLPAAQPDPDADGVHQHRDGRGDQVRRQRLPRDQDHLHQRDRRPLREGRRRRARRGARHRPRRPHRPQVPASRAGLRRLVLSQGHAGAGLHRARGQRAADASSSR